MSYFTCVQELDLQLHWTQGKYDSLQNTELDLQPHWTQVKYDSLQYTELDLQLHWTQVKYDCKLIFYLCTVRL
jgi:hypothetical protein